MLGVIRPDRGAGRPDDRCSTSAAGRGTSTSHLRPPRDRWRPLLGARPLRAVRRALPVQAPGRRLPCGDVLEGGPRRLPRFDYVVANGVFTEKRELSFEEMLAYFEAAGRPALRPGRGGDRLQRHVQPRRLGAGRPVPPAARHAGPVPDAAGHPAFRRPERLRAVRVHGLRLQGALAMARVVVFGLKDFASLAHFYLTARQRARGRRLHRRPRVPRRRRRVRGQAGRAVRGGRGGLPAGRVPVLRADVAPGDEPGARVGLPQGEGQGVQLISYVSSKATTFPGLDRRRELLHPGGQHDPAVRPDRRQRGALERQPHRPPQHDRRPRLLHLARRDLGPLRGRATTPSSGSTPRSATA